MCSGDDSNPLRTNTQTLLRFSKQWIYCHGYPANGKPLLVRFKTANNTWQTIDKLCVFILFTCCQNPIQSKKFFRLRIFFTSINRKRDFTIYKMYTLRENSVHTSRWNSNHWQRFVLIFYHFHNYKVMNTV